MCMRQGDTHSLGGSGSGYGGHDIKILDDAELAPSFPSFLSSSQGRDDNDEEVSTDRFGNSQRLTEEEWAAVKTGR